jgi:hypothetical protein
MEHERGAFKVNIQIYRPRVSSNSRWPAHRSIIAAFAAGQILLQI